MRVTALVLLLANIVMAVYLLWIAPAQRSLLDVRSLELNADQIRQVPEKSAVPAEPTRAKSMVCLEWGPLGATELARARDELAKINVGKIAVREAPDTPVWWVHIPPAKSREEAERRVRDLEERRAKDARIVNEEGWRNAVSLGIFRSEEAAAAHQSRLRGIKVRNTAVVQRFDLIKFSTIVIAEPTPKAAARVVELASAFAGSEVKAAACAASGD